MGSFQPQNCFPFGSKASLTRPLLPSVYDTRSILGENSKPRVNLSENCTHAALASVELLRERSLDRTYPMCFLHPPKRTSRKLQISPLDLNRSVAYPGPRFATRERIGPYAERNTTTSLMPDLYHFTEPYIGIHLIKSRNSHLSDETPLNSPKNPKVKRA
jgi:hypothetical protein